VLIATGDRRTTALALIELGGVARRLVSSPPDVPSEHLPAVIADAEADAVVTAGKVGEREAHGRHAAAGGGRDCGAQIYRNWLLRVSSAQTSRRAPAAFAGPPGARRAEVSVAARLCTPVPRPHAAG